MKKIVTLFMLILLTQLVSAMSFEEFAKTYNYTYDANETKFLNISITSCVNPCKNLTLKLILNNTPGNYEYNFLFNEKTYSKNKYSFGGEDSIDAIFYPEFKETFSSLLLIVKKDGALVYRSIFDINLSGLDFYSRNITLLKDARVNNSLVITLLLNDMNLENQTITAYISSNSTIYESQIILNSSEDQNVSLIFNIDEDSEFKLYKIEIGNYTLKTNYSLEFYNLSKTKILNDSLNREFLQIYLFNPENLSVKMNLYSTNDEFILNTTTKNDSAFFNLTYINSSGFFGQYKILYSTNESNSSKTYFTNYYSVEDVNKSLTSAHNQISDDNSTIIDEIKETIIEIKQKFSGFASSFLNEEKTNQTITTESNVSDEDKVISVNNTSTQLVENSKDENQENSLSNKTTNQITGNVIFETSKENFLNKKIIIFTALLICSIIIGSYVYYRQKMSEVVIIK